MQARAGVSPFPNNAVKVGGRGMPPATWLRRSLLECLVLHRYGAASESRRWRVHRADRPATTRPAARRYRSRVHKCRVQMRRTRAHSISENDDSASCRGSDQFVADPAFEIAALQRGYGREKIVDSHHFTISLRGSCSCFGCHASRKSTSSGSSAVGRRPSRYQLMPALSGLAVANASFAQPQRGAGIRPFGMVMVTGCLLSAPRSKRPASLPSGSRAHRHGCSSSLRRKRDAARHAARHRHPRRSAVEAGHALSFQSQHLPVLGAFGNVTCKVFPSGSVIVRVAPLAASRKATGSS